MFEMTRWQAVEYGVAPSYRVSDDVVVRREWDEPATVSRVSYIEYSVEFGRITVRVRWTECGY